MPPGPPAPADPDDLLVDVLGHQAETLRRGKLLKPELAVVLLCANCEDLSWDLRIHETPKIHRLADLSDLPSSGLAGLSQECPTCGARMGEGAIVRVGYTHPFPGEGFAIHTRVAFRAGAPLAIVIWKIDADGARAVADEASEAKVIEQFGRPFSVAGAWQEAVAAALDEGRAQRVRLAEGYHLFAIPARDTKEETDREMNALSSRLRFEDPVDAGLTDPEAQGMILRGSYIEWAKPVAHLIHEAKVACRVFADRAVYLRTFSELASRSGLTVMAQGPKLTVIRGGFTDRLDIDNVILDSIYFARLPRESCARFVARFERQLGAAARMKELLAFKMGDDRVEVVDNQVEIQMGLGYSDRLDVLTPARTVGGSISAMETYVSLLEELSRRVNVEYDQCPCGLPAQFTKRIGPLYWSPGWAGARKAAGSPVELKSESFKTCLAMECGRHVIYVGLNQIGNWEMKE
ncbi:MAG TPA: hypothetical protein VI893_01770, partial [Thermoplasmata archaeon]|nr:hypothetical protein [Thermoplasmata archaeon]